MSLMTVYHSGAVSYAKLYCNKIFSPYYVSYSHKAKVKTVLATSHNLRHGIILYGFET